MNNYLTETNNTRNMPLYVAVDSDILRRLAYLEFMKIKHGYVEINTINDNHMRSNFNYYNRVLKSVKEDQVRLLVVDAVFQESKHSENLLDFMKNYCYFPNVNATNYQEKSLRACYLALAYSSPYKHDGQEYEAPMKLEYVAAFNKNVPTNDAFIMAQATVENCCLLTGNEKDFIFDKKQNLGNKDRLYGIHRINIAHGYYEEDGDKLFTARPITLINLAEKLKYETRFGVLEQGNDQIAGRTIL